MVIPLKTGVYKGVTFIFTEVETKGGARLIIHRFPSKDKQSVERVGKIPREYNLKIVVPHANYYTDRDNLIRVFEEAGSGTLVHPTWGAIPKAIVKDYTLTERLTELGRAEIAVSFVLDDSPNISAVPSVTTSNEVRSIRDAAFDLSEVEFVASSWGGGAVPNQWSVVNIDKRNILEKFIDFFNGVSADGGVVPDLEEITNFDLTISQFKRDISGFLSEPEKLFEGVRGLFDGVVELFVDPNDKYIALDKFTRFEASEVPLAETTVTAQLVNQNRSVFEATIQYMATVDCHAAASEAEYTTSEELEARKGDLEIKYQRLRTEVVPAPNLSTGTQKQILGNGVRLNSKRGISNSQLETLDQQRVATQEVLDTAAVSTPRVFTIQTQTRPLSVILYQYYGNTNNLAQISELNNIKENAFVSGDIKLLTEVS